MVVDFAASAAAVLDGSAPSEHYIGLGIAALVLLASCWNIITGLSVMHLPGPPKLPIFGNALSVMKEPWNQFARWHKQYGDIYTFGVWTLNMVAVCDADAIKTILRTKADNFQKDDWTYDTFRPILGRGLVTTKGAKWQKHRRMLKPAFHFDALRRLHPVFTSAAERLCRKWSGLSAERNAVELGLTFRTVTLEVISEVAVGLGPDEAGVLPVLFESVLDELNQRVMQPWRRFMWTEAEHQSKLKQLNELVFAIIAQRRAERKSRSSLGDKAAAPADTRRIAAALGGDMLDMMLQADEEAVAENKGPALTDEELADELKTMLLAGHETTSMMLLWSCYLLARHPDKFKVAREEVDAALGTYDDEFGDFAEYDAFKSLEYLECVMFEAMRLYTPVPVLTRDTLVDTELCGKIVPKGSCVVMSCWALHRDPRIWGEDAEEFRPERFSKEERKGRHNFAYMPFSLGKRDCIGRNLALMEAKVVLGTILQRWDLELTASPHGDGAATKDGRVATDSYVIPVRPDGGLWMKVKPRA